MDLLVEPLPYIVLGMVLNKNRGVIGYFFRLRNIIGPGEQKRKFPDFNSFKVFPMGLCRSQENCDLPESSLPS